MFLDKPNYFDESEENIDAQAEELLKQLEHQCLMVMDDGGGMNVPMGFDLENPNQNKKILADGGKDEDDLDALLKSLNKK